MARKSSVKQLSSADQLLYAAEAEECRRSFRKFIDAAWKVLEPGTPMLNAWHIDCLAEHLQAVMDGQITRLVINIGPGHTKSTIVSQAFTAWVWTREPSIRMLCASTDLPLAIRDNRNARYLIESDWYRNCYGREFALNQTVFSMSDDQNMKSYFENDRKGYRQGISVGAKGIGKRGDILLIDDPHDPREGDAKRQEVLEWYAQTWYSRLNDQEHGRMITVGQRIHSEDLCGRILKLGGCEHLCLPEEFEPSRRCVTSIGWCDPRDKAGELLWPEKFPLPVVSKLKDNLGSMGFAAQFQQSPVPSSGGQFKEKWFRYFSIEGDHYLLETPEGIRRVRISDCWRFTVVDLAVSTKQSADWTVIQTFDVTPANELLLFDQIRGHFDNPEQQRIIRVTYFRLKPQFVQIEAIAYQLAIIQQLRDEPVSPILPGVGNIATMQEGDLLIRAYGGSLGNPEAIDKTLQALPGMTAFLVKDNDQYVMYANCWVARVKGDIYFFKYTCEQQGYCTIVSAVEEEHVKAYEYEQKQKRSQKYSIPIREYKPVRDKVSRASAPALLMEQGKFYFLKTLPELHVVKTEYLTFPKGVNDDIVDCGSQAAEVIFVPTGPVIWSPDALPTTQKSPEVAPLTGQVSSIYEQPVSAYEGEMYDFEGDERLW